MISLPSFLLLMHLLGLALGVGAASAKLLLLYMARADNDFVSVFLKVARPITRLILVGIVLLTLSGIIWLFLGYPVTSSMVVKLVLVGTIWMLGPVIDKVVEPKFRRLAPRPGEAALPNFNRVRTQYLSLEVTATGLFYGVIIFWVLFSDLLP